MKLISSLIICLALSACASDYVSRLSEPDYGRVQSLHYSEYNNMDPTLMMNGVYASKQLNGSGVSGSLGAFCLSSYRCSQQPPLWASGSIP
jgi:type III secretory pathway lipoprotein EscJ